MTQPNLQARRFRRHEYHMMAEQGILSREERVELIDGMVIPMSPQNLAHATSIRLANMLLTRCYGQTHIVSCQTPLNAGEDCEPEPDFSLFTFEHMRDCLAQGSQPTRPDLVLEIADTSLRYDRVEKAALYARAQIPEYWLLDLHHRRLEIRLQPGPDSDAVFGHGYRLLRIVQEDEDVSPAFAPDQTIRVAQLLPPVTT